MKNLHYKAFLGLAALMLTGMFSGCSDEETYDFPGDTYNRVYLKDNAAAYKLVITPVSTVSNLDVNIPIHCTKKANGIISATVELDNTLIETYNAKHDTHYVALPDGALKLTNAVMTIPAGSMASSDTLRVQMTDNQEMWSKLDASNEYLIPLRLTKVIGADAQASTNVYYSYLTLSVTEDNVNHDASEEQIKGSLVKDQSSWTAMSNGTASNLQNLFDGDMTQTGRTSIRGSELYLDINMGRPYTFDAITLYSGWSYPGWGEYINGQFSGGMRISISMDGKTWTGSGEIAADSYGDKVCVFYAPLTAQYIRIIKPDNGYNNSISAGVFNIYEIK